MSETNLELEKIETSNKMIPYNRSRTYGNYYPKAYIGGFVEGSDEKDGVTIISELWRTVRKRKWLILALTVLLSSIICIEIYRVPPTFSSAVILEIRKENAPIIGSNDEGDVDNAVSINTKMLMFHSRPLLEDVVTKLKLDQNQKFYESSRKRSWLGTVKAVATRWIGSSQEGSTAAGAMQASELVAANDSSAQFGGELGSLLVGDPQLDRYVSILENNMSVTHLRDTQALKISFTHADPVIAAVIANGVAQSFIQRNLEAKIGRFTDTSNWLDRATRDLKSKVEQSDKALTDYTRQNNIFPTMGQQTLTTDKLMRLHEQATRAEIDLLLKKSLYEEVQKGHTEQLPEAFADQRLNDLQKKYNDLSVSASQLSVSYGPENPRVVEVKQQMIKLQEQIDSSKAALIAKLKTEYERVFKDSQSLNLALDQAKSEAVQQDQASVQFNILKQNLDTAKGLYTEFLQKTNQANLEVAKQPNNVSIIQPAQVSKSPDGPNRGMTVLLALMFSLGGAVGLAVVIERFDKTIKNVSDITRYINLPTLGVIPSATFRKKLALKKDDGSPGSEQRSLSYGKPPEDKRTELSEFRLRFLPFSGASKKGSGRGYLNDAEIKRRRILMLDPGSAIAEAYRALRTSVLLCTGDKPPKTILFTSGQPGEGKTTTVINTAVSLAQLGASVLIIDADLRKPTTHRGFGVEGKLGLSAYLSQKGSAEAPIQRLRIPNLSLLPCGPIPSNPAELIGSAKIKELLKTVSSRYDYVLIDSPPLLYVTDPVILATLVDGVIMVVRSGKSTRDAVTQSHNLLINANANVLGIVLNNVRASQESYAGFAYYPYKDYATNRNEEGASDLLL